MAHYSASANHRHVSDRRKTDGFAPLGGIERRLQAERRGFELVESDFDERIAMTIPAPRGPSVGR